MAWPAAARGYLIQKCERTGPGVDREAADIAISLIGIRARLGHFRDGVEMAVSRIGDHKRWVRHLCRDPEWRQTAGCRVETVPVNSFAIGVRICPNIYKVAMLVMRGTRL